MGNIKDFCSEVATTKPFLVPVRPSPTAAVDDCYFNAREEAARAGGEAVFGWAIYEWPGVFVEAIHHAVVKVGQTYVDVSPNDDGWIYFIPDSAAPNDYNKQKGFDNKRKALTDDPLVHQFLAQAAEKTRLQFAYPAGPVQLSRDEARPLLEISDQHAMIYRQLLERCGRQQK